MALTSSVCPENFLTGSSSPTLHTTMLLSVEHLYKYIYIYYAWTSYMNPPYPIRVYAYCVDTPYTHSYWHAAHYIYIYTIYIYTMWRTVDKCTTYIYLHMYRYINTAGGESQRTARVVVTGGACPVVTGGVISNIRGSKGAPYIFAGTVLRNQCGRLSRVVTLTKVSLRRGKCR